MGLKLLNRFVLRASTNSALPPGQLLTNSLFRMKYSMYKSYRPYLSQLYRG